MTRSSQIRVCIFSYYFPPHFSGAGIYALSLAKELVRRGVELFILTVDSSGLPKADTYEGLTVYRIPDAPRRHGECLLWWNMWRALRKRQAHFDVIHANGSTYRASAVGPLGRLLRKKSLTVVTLANDDLYFIGRRPEGLLQQAFLACVDRYVSLSVQITEELRALPLDFRRVVQIPQGVDVGRFAPATENERAAIRAEEALPAGPLALFVGAIGRRKNVEWLVRIWAKNCRLFDGWRLLIVGPPSRWEPDHDLGYRLQKFVHDQRLEDRILFRPFSPTVERCYRAADLFILPSENEGMANVLLEAMGCGLPCVATRISGTTDLITHGKSGMLFAVGDEADFLDAVLPVVRDPGFRAELGAQARREIVHEYSLGAIADRYIELYQEMLEET